MVRFCSASPERSHPPRRSIITPPFTVLFGSDKPPVSDLPVSLTVETDDARHQIEPFNYVSNGLEAWEAGDHERAEGLLRQGVQAYRLDEPDGVDLSNARNYVPVK